MLTSLASWLTVCPQQIIARNKSVTLDTADFVSRIQQWHQQLKKYSGQRWAIYHHDSYEFAAILFALWQLERIASIPGNNLPATTQQLDKTVDGFIGDFPCPTIPSPTNSELASASVDWRSLSNQATAIEIYTSGSTGQAQAITKTFSQLDSEITVLETLWPSQAQQHVLSTVSHQHLYGLTFRLFWPLCSQRSFAQKSCIYPEDILLQAEQAEHFSLISSPAHLSRINPALDWQSIQHRCQSVISSAAPLTKKDSLLVTTLLAVPVNEIYGSSETGALAWRNQANNEKEALWQALPSITLQEDDHHHLVAEAPFINQSEPFISQDKVRFDSAQSFQLLGRVDRIVKIEGKRISLTEIEKDLLNHPWIEQASVIVLNRRRGETAAVIVLSKIGKTVFQQGRKPLIQQLKLNLADKLEHIAIPKRWRFVGNLPYNTQNKLPLATLEALFTVEKKNWPIIKAKQVNEQQAQLQCIVPEDLIYFDGHFRQHAILPGIVQVHWAEHWARECFNISASFYQLEKIKFQNIIVPNMEINIDLDYEQSSQKLSFKFSSADRLHASGIIRFNDE